MVEDTPMNRARKKQQQREQAVQTKQKVKSPRAKAKPPGLKQDKHEEALWGGGDSDESEESESADESEDDARPNERRAKTGPWISNIPNCFPLIVTMHISIQLSKIQKLDVDLPEIKRRKAECKGLRKDATG